MAQIRAEILRGREAYSRLAWADAYDSLSRAEGSEPLAAEDLELLATSAHMIGRGDEWLGLLESTYQRYSDAGEVLRAVRCAFWIGMNLALRGEMGPAHGVARTRSAVAGAGGQRVCRAGLHAPARRLPT